MTTDPHIKLTAELSIEDGDLLLAITDGYGKMSIVRHPIPSGSLVVAWNNREIAGGDIRIVLSHYGTASLSIANRLLIANLSPADAMLLAEAMYGGPIPDAPHQCAVVGCDHGHAA